MGGSFVVVGCLVGLLALLLPAAVRLKRVGIAVHFARRVQRKQRTAMKRAAADDAADGGVGKDEPSPKKTSIELVEMPHATRVHLDQISDTSFLASVWQLI